MNHRFTVHLTALAAVALLLVGASQALAVGTAANTLISNEASVTFTINGGTPPAVTDTADFYVDHKVRVVVANTSGTNVVPGGSNYILPFTVTNESNTEFNASLWFQLKVESRNDDDFDQSGASLSIWYDSDKDGDYLDEDAANELTADIAENGYIQISPVATGSVNIANILIVSDTPNIVATQTTGKVARYHLIATAWNGDTDLSGIMVKDSDGNNDGASEVVFADDAATDAPQSGADAIGNGWHAALGTYTTNWSNLTVAKTVSNGTSGYQIPGDEITYTIKVTNSTGSAVSGVTVTDNLASLPVTYKPDSIYVTAPNINGGARILLSDGSDGDAGSFTGTTVTVNGINLANTQEAIVEFTVEIN